MKNTSPIIKSLLYIVGIAVVIGILIQFIPYGHDLNNPPVKSEPAWDSPQTRELAKRACFDCHSNESQWPWYSKVAPASWLLQHDVDEGRATMNFSEWDEYWLASSEIAETINEGEMPPPQYLIMHPEARLSDAEKKQLANGIK